MLKLKCEIKLLKWQFKQQQSPLQAPLNRKLYVSIGQLENKLQVQSIQLDYRRYPIAVCVIYDNGSKFLGKEF